VLQFMYHEEEVRDFSEIARAEGERLTPAEFDLATGLVEKLSSAEFEPEAYGDEYRVRVKAMLDQKAKGQEITVAPPAPPRGGVVDIYAALKKSL
jgi:DNA end-binding protein Ku